jgi:hypothetical protein
MANLLKLDTRTLTSKDGTEVFAQAIGDPAKPSVIFCHGDYPNDT